MRWISRFLFLLAAVLLLMTACLNRGELHDSESGQKGFESTPVLDPDLGIQGERYAVCIGISSYDNLPSLKYAHRDAEDMYDFLVSPSGGYKMDNCILLCDTNADEGKVRKHQMESLLTTWMARVRPEDSVFIFYSGHGLPYGRDRAFIATYDTDPDDLYPSAIPLHRVSEYLNEMIAAECVVVALDTCFSGALNSKSYLPAGLRTGAFDDINLERVAKGRGRVILTASSGRQAAHELSELGHGIFTYCMLEGLRGDANLNRDAKVTLSELWLYLQQKVPRVAGRRGIRQNPVRKGDESGEMLLARALTMPTLEDINNGNGNTAQALQLVLDGTNLLNKGFFSAAEGNFLQALPLTPEEKRADLEKLISECRSRNIQEKTVKSPAPTQGDDNLSVMTAPFVGTVVEKEFTNGVDAERYSLWERALDHYGAALKKAPDELIETVQTRIDFCKTKIVEETKVAQVNTLFYEAKANPSQKAYRAVLSKLDDLYKMGCKTPELELIEKRAREEDSGDQSRKYFTWGQLSRKDGRWREAIQWFEKAREGAGGRYPEEIEINLSYSIKSLEEAIRENEEAAKKAFTSGAHKQCLKFCDEWISLSPHSKAAQALKLKAARARAQILFARGSFAVCRAFISKILVAYPNDLILGDLASRSAMEDIPEVARDGWNKAMKAEKEGRWAYGAKVLHSILNSRPDMSFNSHYRDLAESKMIEFKLQAYKDLSEKAKSAFADNEVGRALVLAEKALEFDAGSKQMKALISKIEQAASAEEVALYKEAVSRESNAISDLTDQTQTRRTEDYRVDWICQGYSDYLNMYPSGVWVDKANAALKRIERDRGNYPEVKGFWFDRSESFTCGLITNRVAIYIHEKTGLEFVLISGGSFMMGARPQEKGRPDYEGPQVSCSVAPFMICRTECTQAAWDRFKGKDRRRWDGDQLPIEMVNWEECSAWCRQVGLRLPTAKEWEFACRAGSDGAYCFGETIKSLAEYAWYDLNARNRTHKVAIKFPNSFGIYDMHGNVWEWCQDQFINKNDNRNKIKTRVTRGGAWGFNPLHCRSACSTGDIPHQRSGALGFRPACSVE